MGCRGETVLLSAKQFLQNSPSKNPRQQHYQDRQDSSSTCLNILCGLKDGRLMAMAARKLMLLCSFECLPGAAADDLDSLSVEDPSKAEPFA
jgi:hypothetical protein